MKRVLTLAMAVSAVWLSACSSAPAGLPGRGEVTAGAEFGADCATLFPATSGGTSSLKNGELLSNLGRIPQFQTFVSDVTAASFDTSLNTATGVTLFVPTNRAFELAERADSSFPTATSGNPSDPNGPLLDLLTYHVIQGRLGPSQLVGAHRTLEGKVVTVTSTEGFVVNGSASILCGNIQAPGVTIYVIDKVLRP